MILVLNMCKHKLSEDEFVLPITDQLTDFEVKHYTETYDLDRYDGTIICGTALKDDGYLDNLDRFAWIKDYKKPLFGICAGMQVIALVHGSTLIESKQIGVTEKKLNSNDPLLEGITKVYELHKFSVTLPEQFRSILSDDDRLLAFRKDDCYGLLFHPEVFNKQVIQKFEKLCKGL